MNVRAAMSDVSSAASLEGRVCVVTGATRGIGEATARALAARGATVVTLGRDRDRLARAAARLEASAKGGGRVVPVLADLASFDAIRAAAREITGRFGAVHALVNNAGVSVARRRLSADGVELTFAVNVLAPFLLTCELLPSLRAGAPARVVNVTSVFARFARIEFDDLQSERSYSPDRAYLQSKLAVVVLTQAWAARMLGTGVTALSVDPGLAATDLLRERWWWRARGLQPLWRRIFLTPDEAARASVLAVTSPALANAGGGWIDRNGREVRLRRRWRDRKVAERLWGVCEDLTNSNSSSEH